MAEGHTVHALAHRFSAAFVAHEARAFSPQGTALQVAESLDGQAALDAQAYGKNLVVSYSDDRWLHVHLGMFGRFQVRQHRRVRPAVPPADLPLRGAVRLRLVTLIHVGDLRAPTICRLLDQAGLRDLLDRLGPDPIRPNADPERAWRVIGSSNRPIAALLMDQSVIAGIGNVYRAELLHRAELDPYLLGRDLNYDRWLRLWKDTVSVMSLGAAANRIYTRPIDLDWAADLLDQGQTPPRRRPTYSVYARTGRSCPRCGDIVQSARLESRTLYWCPGCQH